MATEAWVRARAAAAFFAGLRGGGGEQFLGVGDHDFQVGDELVLVHFGGYGWVLFSENRTGMRIVAVVDGAEAPPGKICPMAFVEYAVAIHVCRA